MVEYARCIYEHWASKYSQEYVQTHEHEFLAICSMMLKYTPEELHTRLAKEPWYKH